MTIEDKKDPVAPDADTQPKDIAEESVSFQHHQSVKADMMKYKAEKRELKDRLESIEKKQKEADSLRLEENKEWEKLAKLKDVELQSLLTKQEETQEQMVNSHKRAAVINVVGGFVKNTYADMAINLDNILMTDGVIDQASLDAECERVKKEHGVLLKKTFSPKLPQGAPNGTEADLNYSDMSQSQKSDLRQQVVLSRINKK